MRIFSKPWVLALAALVVGFVAGYVLPSPAQTGFSREEREHGDATYQFINPLLSCGEGNFNHLGNDETRALEDKLLELVAKQKAEGKITDAGIYFRELNGGPWVGVNFETKFTPGSLLKVPLVMSVFQISETDPMLLDRVIEYESGTAPGVQYFGAPTITPGLYSVRDLIKATLSNSDNTAATLLAQLIGRENLDYAYSHLGIQVPVMGQDYEASVRDYASFFRILYNATYLDRMDSEELLSYLAKSEFKEGIVAGVPVGTVVAHKFGERSITGDATVQLHDCGIVYHPVQPYLLCVMMRGKDFDVLAASIANVSKTAYESVD